MPVIDSFTLTTTYIHPIYKSSPIFFFSSKGTFLKTEQLLKSQTDTKTRPKRYKLHMYVCIYTSWQLNPGSPECSMGEEYITNVILAELLSACGALPVSVAQVFVNALLAEKVEAAGDGRTLKPIFADRAAQHAQSHVQHILFFLPGGTATTTTIATTATCSGTTRAAAATATGSLLHGCLQLGELPLLLHPVDIISMIVI
jgi:hypothetical protein